LLDLENASRKVPSYLRCEITWRARLYNWHATRIIVVAFVGEDIIAQSTFLSVSLRYSE